MPDFGLATSDFLLDDVLCQKEDGTVPDTIADCRHAGWGDSDCTNDQIARVRCGEPGTRTFYNKILQWNIDCKGYVSEWPRKYFHIWVQEMILCKPNELEYKNDNPKLTDSAWKYLPMQNAEFSSTSRFKILPGRIVYLLYVYDE